MVLNGTGSVYDDTGWYFVSISWYCLVLGGTWSAKGLYACIYWKKWRLGRVTPILVYKSIKYKLSLAIRFLQKLLLYVYIMNTANGAARYAQAGWWFIQIKTPCPVLHVQYKNIQIYTIHICIVIYSYMSKYPKRHILSIRTQKKRKDKFDKFDQDFIAISNITHAENCFYCIFCHIFLRVTTWKCSLIDIISVER